MKKALHFKNCQKDVRYELDIFAINWFIILWNKGILVYLQS